MLTVITLILLGVTTVATVAMAIFNFQLVGVTHQMKKATAEAADAAKRALFLDRPFLYTSQPELVNLYSDSQTVNASFGFKNWGRSPAFVFEIRARLGVVKSLDVPTAVGEQPPKQFEDSFPMELSYSDDAALLQIRNRVIEPKEDYSSYRVYLQTGDMEPDLALSMARHVLRKAAFDRVADKELPTLKIDLKGIIHYRDAAQFPYWTEFHWTFDFGDRRSRDDPMPGRFRLVFFRDSQQEEKK